MLISCSSCKTFPISGYDLLPVIIHMASEKKIVNLGLIIDGSNKDVVLTGDLFILFCKVMKNFFMVFFFFLFQNSASSKVKETRKEEEDIEQIWDERRLRQLVRKRGRVLHQ